MSLDAGGHLTHGFRHNISGKLFEQASYGTDPRDRAARLRRDRRPGPRVQPADPGGRLLGLPADPELPDPARDRRRGRRHADGGHGALRGPGGRRRADRRPEPGPVRRGGHLHHAQVAARPARRVRAVHRRVRPLRGQGLPDGARRPAAARHGGQGGRVRRGPAAVLRRLRVRGSSPTPTRWPRACCGAASRWSPAAPATTSCCSTSAPASG